MAVDVTPELKEGLFRRFNDVVGSDRYIKSFLKNLEKGKATQSQLNSYADHLGRCMAKACNDVLKQESLPDGRLWWNIAEGTVKPLMEKVNKSVDDAFVSVLTTTSRTRGINLKVRTKNASERITEALNYLTQDDSDKSTTLAKRIKSCCEVEPLQRLDENMNADAEFKKSAGLRVMVVRTAEANCCEWCRNLEGSWIKGTEPSDAWARHDNCKCIVDYDFNR